MVGAVTVVEVLVELVCEVPVVAVVVMTGSPALEQAHNNRRTGIRERIQQKVLKFRLYSKVVVEPWKGEDRPASLPSGWEAACGVGLTKAARPYMVAVGQGSVGPAEVVSDSVVVAAEGGKVVDPGRSPF